MARSLAVVVPTRDRPDRLDRCLGALRSVLAENDELVVVDSASASPGPVAAVCEAHGARLLRAGSPGSDLARNVGWRATTSDLVLFVDDDVAVEPGWADAYRSGVDGHGFATGWVGAPEGSRHRVAVKTDEVQHDLTLATRGPLGHGASTAVTREALEAIGGWDEQLGAGARFRSAPEQDLYDRLLRAGYLGVYLPQARAVHEQWRTDRQLAGLHLRYAVGAGARLAKLLRTDRGRFRVAGREFVWEWGLRDVVTEVRHGRLPQAGVGVLRLGGYVWGFLSALLTPVRDGHFAPRHR